jgi:putative holliday junction resolvase
MIPATNTTSRANNLDSGADRKSTRILGVDYGRKRIGLALSDELGMIARPLETIVRTNRQNDLRRLREICRKHGVGQVVVGHPVHLSGQLSPIAGEAARFAVRLQKELGMAVELVDERLTSWEAKRTVAKNGARQQFPVDDVAAAVLLRDYLEQTREPSQRKASEGTRKG